MIERLLAPVWARALCAATAGALAPLSLAPYKLWPCGLISIMVLIMTMRHCSGKFTTFLAFAYGLGLYGVGASWVYISISQFGSTSIALSLAMTAVFVAGLAICFSLPFYAYGRWFSCTRILWVFAFPAIWVLDEWMRSWFLTGFPWLYLGYGHLETGLAGWAPVFGVFGLSFAIVYTASVILLLMYLRYDHREPALRWCTGAALLICLAGSGLNHIEWTELEDKPISVGMAQGNIPQDRKWDPLFLNPTFKIFNGLSDELWQYDWVIWPEAAIPLMYHEAEGDLAALDEQAKKTNTVFITGILYDNREKFEFYNSVIAQGLGSGMTFKTRLVPFGEYVPLEEWLRGLINFFNLPTSIIHMGPEYTKGLQANGVEIAPSICYEVVYPDLVAERAASANVLLTISNDAWFGLSIGPIQHFEMARMRALETGRYMIRSTNNGVSGIIDHKGRVLQQGGRYTRENIVGVVHSASGNTPFLIWRSWPMVIACFALLFFLGRKRKQ